MNHLPEDLRDLGLRPYINARINQRNDLARRLNTAHGDDEADQLTTELRTADAELAGLSARWEAAETRCNTEADAHFIAEQQLFAKRWDGEYPHISTAAQTRGKSEFRSVKDLEDTYGPADVGDLDSLLAIYSAAEREAERASRPDALASDSRRAEHLRTEARTALAKAQTLFREIYRSGVIADPSRRQWLPSPTGSGWITPSSPDYQAARAAARGDVMFSALPGMGPQVEDLGNPRYDGEAVNQRGQITGVPFVRSGDGEVATVARGQRFADHAIVSREAARSAARDQAVIGQHGNLGNLVRAMTTSGGSAIVPTVWASDLIDKARNASAVISAGAQIVPMDAKVVQIGRLTTDPTAAFRAEGSAITASDPGFDNVTLTAKTLSALVIGSLEWFDDADNADQIVVGAIAQAMASRIDLVALYGGQNVGGVDLTAATNPTGLAANLAANATTSVLGGATNGTTQTAASFYNELLDLAFTPKDFNEAPNAAIWNSKAARMYAKAYDSTYQPLRRPADLDALQWFVSNQIPSYTQGTMSNVATDVFCGDFSQLLIGQRLDVSIQLLTERYADNGQIGIVATWRGDVGVARPRAFSLYKAIKGS